MKKVLIVGNGKSSCNPNAEGLNKGKDVFRINKFFLEPKKTFGNDIKLVTISGEPYTIYILEYLIKKGIYKVQIPLYREMTQKRFFIPSLTTNIDKWSKFESKYSLENKIPGFNAQNKIDKVKKVDKITTGPYLVNLAIQMGYEDISIIGIDFYSEKSNKKYPILIPKCLKDISIFDPQFRSVKRNKEKKNSYDDLVHSIESDMLYLNNLIELYPNVNFNIYVDESNPYHNWQKIATNFKNINLVKLDDNIIEAPQKSNCLNEIECAINNYKKKYLYKHNIMNFRNNWSNRKSAVKKFYSYITDKF